MKYKRIVSILVEGTVLISSFGLLSGGVDPILQQASDFTYKTFNSILTKHKKICIQCDARFDEAHFFKKQGMACLYCKYLPNKIND